MGVNLVANKNQLYTVNYPSTYKKLSEDLNHWASSDLSLLGKENSVKMTLLPRLLYLFRSLPTPILKSQLLKFQSKIICFVWGNKDHWCPKSDLFQLCAQGGLGLPNLWRYYQAAQLAQISIVYACGNRPDWVSMERHAFSRHTIAFLLWCLAKSSSYSLTLHGLV